ncbi:MAG: thioredoxin-dependent thiol peroxidase [Corynebacterium sp.]|nr:thioredoxin-dependent thiol peroxidase [Corynebacterium sp.]
MTAQPVTPFPAPTFTLTSDSGADVSLPDEGYALVYFYPRANTPGCTTEACDFRDNIARFNALNMPVLGISPDPVNRLEKFRDDHDLSFPLLSDPDHAVAEAYGAWGEKKNYGKTTVGIIRSTFLIHDGEVIQAWRNVRAKGHVDRVVKALAELGL